MFATCCLPVLATLGLVTVGFGEGEQRFFDVGDLKLESGKTLQHCKVGYRIFGTLNAKKDNAVLVPTWYLGTTDNLRGAFQKGGLADSSKYYVIAVDALTNGVSTSPSNSEAQHDADFPTVGIRDIVESQHSMLIGMGIPHLRAVLGISMAGIQTFQWVAAYPDFMDKAIPIVGSPRASSYDLMNYHSGIDVLTAAIGNNSAKTALVTAFGDYFYLSLHTPTYYVRTAKRETALSDMRGFAKGLLAWDLYDARAGLEALADNDLFKAFGEDEAKAAAAIHAKLLVIVASQDHCVNPAPALSLAKLLGAETLILDDDAGHQSPGEEMGKVGPAIDRFLAQ